MDFSAIACRGARSKGCALVTAEAIVRRGDDRRAIQMPMSRKKVQEIRKCVLTRCALFANTFAQLKSIVVYQKSAKGERQRETFGVKLWVHPEIKAPADRLPVITHGAVQDTADLAMIGLALSSPSMAAKCSR
ncbi:hypothetical protein [Bradyrhizobium australiense]|uniref:Uncharacterized protein n=1 Tax=Bradyrhizobium australiense TaxID=2721161 RepID=A0A7Y4LW69_9BRAD|nr:hypothetical protein [Bradyrhizobium australiense]NOJ41098.1 hypothetical protein [Bradyrhizobium australiense]